MPSVMEVIVRARDQASRVLDQVGASGKRAGRDVNSGAARASKAMTRFRSTAEKVWTRFKQAARVALLAAGAAIGVFILKAVKGAADLGESINKTNVIFKGSAKEILQWSKGSANSLGISRAAALDAAGGYGAMFQALGLNRKASADMSVSLVKLAADMGSLHNQDPTEMLEKIRAGMSGEMEPLKQFGIVLSETAVKQHAWKTGIAETGEELTEAQKVQARYSLLMEQSSSAHGDFARTSNSLPNIMRRLGAIFTDVSARVGKALIPTIEKLAKQVADFAQSRGFQEWLKEASEWLSRNVPKAIEVTGKAFGFLQRNAGTLARVVGSVLVAAFAVKLVNAIRTVNALLSTNPYVVIIAATVALAMLIITNWDKIQAFLSKVWGWIKDTGSTIWNALKRATGNVLAFLTRMWAGWLRFWFGIAGGILDGAVKAFGWIPGVGDRIRRFRDGFDRVTDDILRDLERQAGKFENWGNRSRGQVGKVSKKVLDLTRNLASLVRQSVVNITAKFTGPSGDGLGILGSGGGTPTGIAQQAIAMFGGAISSGFRPGAITASGNKSLHGIPPPWNAVDFVGSRMTAAARWIASKFGGKLRELIHTPLGFGIKNGRRVPLSFFGDVVNRMHRNHVHVADRGLRLRGPGLVAIGNISEDVQFVPRSGPHAVSGEQHFHYHLTVTGVPVESMDEETALKLFRRMELLHG